MAISASSALPPAVAAPGHHAAAQDFGNLGGVIVRTDGFTADQVTALLDSLVNARGGLPGGAIAGVWVPGKGYWVGAVGKADIRRRTPMKRGLQVPVGSVTKTLTGTIVLQEVQRGRLKLTSHLSKWFPQYPKARQITVGMLLNMTSGIPDFVNGNFAWVTKHQRLHPKRQWLPRTSIRGAARMPRDFPKPGTAFAYSNTNTVILARILEKVTGKSYVTLLQRRLLDPLGMRRSVLDSAGELWPPHAQTYSMLYGQVHGSPRLLRTTGWSRSLEWAAGGLASTLGDMRRWGHALGTGDGVLKPATQRLRTRSPNCIAMGTDGILTQEYCLGVAIYRENATGDIVALFHNGKVLGASSYVGYFPRTDAVVVVQANQDAEIGDSGMTIPDTFAASLRTKVPELIGLR